jgi:hypothetical protein
MVAGLGVDHRRLARLPQGFIQNRGVSHQVHPGSRTSGQNDATGVGRADEVGYYSTGTFVICPNL